MANIYEIDLTLKNIEADEEHHWQNAWGIKIIDETGNVCGTGMCAAGFTVVRHGYKLLFGVNPTVPSNRAFDCMAPDGTVRSIAAVAQKILDLDEGDASFFFAGSNTLDELREMRDELARNGYIDW